MALLLPERLHPAGCFPSMETPEQYSKFAAECRQLARRAENERHREILEQMAKVWSQLAVEAAEKR